MSKAKLNKKDFIFEKRQGETLIRNPGQINGIDFYIDSLENCEVFLMDHSAQILVDDCKNCHLHIGPVETSLFLRGCSNIKLSAACGQLRISDSTNVDCFVFSGSDPTLEGCSNIRFAPYNFFYPHQEQHFQNAKLDPTRNFWSQVFDFNENKASPNWSLIHPQEYPGPIHRAVEGEPEPFNPVEIPVQYGGTIQGPIMVGSQEQGGSVQGEMMSFDIQTGQQNAEEKFVQQVENAQPQNTQINEEHYDDLFSGGGQQPQPVPQQQNQQTYDMSAGLGNQGTVDDGWGGYGNNTQPTTTKQPTPTQDFTGGWDAQPQGGQQGGFGGFDGGFGGQAEPQYDTEEDERRAKLMRAEQERMYKLDMKAREEQQKKQERRSNAQMELQNWKLNLDKETQKRMQENRIAQNQKEEDKYKNSWDKIAANVALKDGEYPGTKDISKFRQAMLNKKSDVSKSAIKF